MIFMRLWYKLISRLFNYYDRRLNKNIPLNLVDIFSKCQLDLYEVRFNDCLLSVDQVNMVFRRMKLLPEQKIALKNMLYQAKVMDEGYVHHEEDAHITGVQFHSDKINPKLWPYDPVIIENSEWMSKGDQEPEPFGVPGLTDTTKFDGNLAQQFSAVVPEPKESVTYTFTNPGIYVFNGTVTKGNLPLLVRSTREGEWDWQ